MGKEWVEGIHYSKEDDGSLTCLKCQRKIKSLPGLGPHLSACFKDSDATKGVEGAKALPSQTMPDEYECLVTMLQGHGVKRPKAIADMMAYQKNWDDYQALQRYLELSGIRVDRQQFIIEAWSAHRGTQIPMSVQNSLQRPRPFTPQHFQQSEQSTYVTKADLKTEGEKTKADLKAMFDEERQKRKEEEEKRQLNRTLRGLSDHINMLEDKVKEQANVRTGKSMYDLLDSGMQTADKRAAEIRDLLTTNQRFKPQVTRSTRQRKAKVQDIEGMIEKRQKILDAEDDLLVAYANLLEEDAAKGGKKK